MKLLLEYFQKVSDMKDCIIKINESLDSLPRREKLLANYILGNLKDVSKMTITTLSKKSKASAATIVRFANRLGYAGYREFTKSLYSDVENGATYPENIM